MSRLHVCVRVQEERLLLFRYIANWLTDSMCGRTSIEDLRVEGLQQMQAMVDSGACEPCLT